MKGKYQTDKNQYPDKKTITTEEIKSKLRDEMSQIGEQALRFYDSFMENANRKYEYRSISGILSLRKSYNNTIIDNACHRVLTYGTLQYKTVKNICEKGIRHLPIDTNVTYLNKKETYLSRPLIRDNSLLFSGKEV